MSHSLLPHNTFGLDVRCKSFVEYADTETLIRQVLPRLSATPWLHIGSGSNLLFLGDYDGTVLHSGIRGIEMLRREGANVWVKAGAGVVWDDFVEWAVKHACFGAENLSLIPGEVGASAVQNIGAYGTEVADLIEEVETVEVATGTVKVFSAEDCDYSYRHSIFKQPENRGKFIVTHVTYRLSTVFRPDLNYKATRRAVEERQPKDQPLTAADLRRIIIDVRREKLPEPGIVGSAGSFFMNPVVSEEKYAEIKQSHPDAPGYAVENGVKVPAGWLIETCGWKGRTVGHAGVWEKQALVLVNRGGATGKEIQHLSQLICEDVKAHFGIVIKPEVNFVEGGRII